MWCTCEEVVVVVVFFLTSSLLSRSWILRSPYYERLTHGCTKWPFMDNKRRYQLFLNEWDISSEPYRLTAHPWPRRAFFVPTSVAFVINFSLIYKTFVVFLIGERINKQDWRRWQRESKKIIGFISTTVSYFCYISLTSSARLRRETS